MQREVEETLVSITRGLKYMDPVFKLTAMGAIMLIQFIARMIKEGKMKETVYTDFSKFIKQTDGKYDIINVPSADGEELGKELEQLGIRHMVMPDINESDGLIQVAVYQPDKDKFAAWNTRHIISFMQGGNKELRDLQNVTNNRTSIITLPFEGELPQIEADFQSLKINYSILPDLYVGDGQLQMVVANADMDRVRQWYQWKKQDLLSEGKDIPEFSTITLDQYQETGNVTEEEYVQNASPEYQQANAKYEGKEKGTLEQNVEQVDKTVKNEHVIAFEHYSLDPSYVPISIDKATLIEKSSYPNLEEFQEKGIFACRVPGTWNHDDKEEEILFVPIHQVFSSNDGENYYAFLKKDLPPVVINANSGDVIMSYAGTRTEDFVANTFDKIEDKFLKIDQGKSKAAEKAINAVGKEILPLKVPGNPVKAI